jgi:hypothetical protein
LPEGFAPSSALDRQSGLPTLRPRGFNGSRLEDDPGEPGDFLASVSSTARHLAVASIRFQNPFFAAGLSAFASEVVCKGFILLDILITIQRQAKKPFRSNAKTQ